MDEVAYAVALVLAGVFAWAGVAKLRDRRLTARTFDLFGLRGARTLAVGVPLAEVGLAVGLVLVPAEAAIAALALLAGFTTIVVRAVQAGVDVGCGCFGTARRGPVSMVEVARNAALGAGALVVAAFATGPVVPGPGAIVVAGGSAALAFGAVAALGRRRRDAGGDRFHGSGPPIGSAAPLAHRYAYATADATVLAFTAPTCERCDALRRSLGSIGAEGTATRVHLVDLGGDDTDVFAAFGVIAVPYVVVVDRTGTVRGHGDASSEGDLVPLLRSVRQDGRL